MGGNARRGHRLVLGRETTAGHQKALARDRHEALVGDVVIIIEQPFELRLFAGMQFDRPSRTRDRALALGAGHDVFVVERGYTPDLPGLADADLHAGIIDERFLAAHQPVL